MGKPWCTTDPPVITVPWSSCGPEGSRGQTDNSTLDPQGVVVATLLIAFSSHLKQPSTNLVLAVCQIAIRMQDTQSTTGLVLDPLSCTRQAPGQCHYDTTGAIVAEQTAKSVHTKHPMVTKEHSLSRLLVGHHELSKQTRKNGYSADSTPSPKRHRSNSATTMGPTDIPDGGHVPGAGLSQGGPRSRNSSSPQSWHRAGETETTETVTGACSLDVSEFPTPQSDTPQT